MNRRIVVMVLTLSACGHPGTAPDHPPPVEPVVAPAPLPETSQVRVPQDSASILAHVRCSWGTTGVAVPGQQPAWVSGFIDVRAPRDLRGLALDRVELLDGADQVVASATSELTLRRVPPGRSLLDFSQYGTDDFDGSVAASTTLRLLLSGRLAGEFVAIGAANPVRYRATLALADGARLTVTGPLEPPWPTA